MHVQAAFEAVCKDAVQAGNGRYVCLMEEVPYYGGPEEGGWWGRDTHVVAFQYFETEEMAEQAKAAVEELAAELTHESRREFGESCLRDLAWLEKRGLDPDYLPEVDGESEFRVIVCESVPSSQMGTRGYS